jgi:ATP phosphoribosyltransferase
MFQEKDIPIQVAVGNYDLGICGLDWIEELLAKYPSSPIIKVADLEYNEGSLYLASSHDKNITSINSLSGKQYSWQIVTEYPNIAEHSALNLRLRKFRIFPVWGSAEAYPPENTDLVILKAKDDSEVKSFNLIPLVNLVSTNAFIIANRESLQTKNLSEIIARFNRGLKLESKPWLEAKPKRNGYSNGVYYKQTDNTVTLALADGHQQKPTMEFLNRAGFKLEDYSEKQLSRRPTINLDWLRIKVIRPQDMPLQVANGNFDLAITGIDWLNDHLCRFPSSPVTKLIDLGFGAVRIVAVVSQDLPADNMEELKDIMASRISSPFRVVSEYVNIADKYLRDNHISQYKLIPTWGASEAFLPEDADLLIENTETGKTIEKHNLKIIETLFQSTACLIGNKKSIKSPLKRDNISSLVAIFRQTLDSK